MIYKFANNETKQKNPFISASLILDPVGIWMLHLNKQIEEWLKVQVDKINSKIDGWLRTQVELIIIYKNIGESALSNEHSIEMIKDSQLNIPKRERML